MNIAATALSLNEAILTDAREVVRRVRRYKFGRLSNRAIVARVRTLADAEEARQLSDEQLLARWFEAFDREFAHTPRSV